MVRIPSIIQEISDIKESVEGISTFVPNECKEVSFHLSSRGCCGLQLFGPSLLFFHILSLIDIFNESTCITSGKTS